MSKNTQAAEEFLEEDVQDEVFAEETTNGSSHIFVKVLSVLLLAGLVAGFFAPVYFSFVDGTFNVYLNGSILGGEGSSLFNLMLTGIQDFMAGSEKSFALFARLVWTNKYLYGIAVAGALRGDGGDIPVVHIDNPRALRNRARISERYFDRIIAHPSL